MDISSIVNASLEYFQNFDGAKALQVAHYFVALVLASIGLWNTIRYAESKMPKRLLEFASRFEGRIVEAKLVGAIGCFGLLITEVAFRPPVWVEIVVWLPLMAILTLLALRPFKSVMLSLQFHNRASEARNPDHDRA